MFKVAKELNTPIIEEKITDEFMSKMLSVVPTKAQLEWQNLDYYAFIHYSINTFNVPPVVRSFISGIEWSNGSIPAKNFNPKKQDADQWCKVIKDAGMKGVIITAKHHDGFVLFDTKFEYPRKNKRGLTRYSIKDAPYKNGQGDIVREVCESCKKYGLKFGIYYSPWDRSHPDYGMDVKDPKIYNDYMINQVEELCTNYGEVFEVWLDTAIGEESEGKPHKYEWDRLLATIKKHQPNCMIAFGNDFRYIGNENGDTLPAEWCISHSGPVKNNHGSRENLEKYDNWRWYPVEVNVPNHSGWYFHSNDMKKPYKYSDNKWYNWCSPVRTPEILFDIYLRTVGGNGNFLLNFPPDYNGLIHPTDVKQVMDLKDKIDAIYKKPITEGTVTVKDSGVFLTPCLTDDENVAVLNSDTTEITFDIEKSNLGYIIIKEDLTKSQRVEKYVIYLKQNGEFVRFYEGITIGKRKIIDIGGFSTDSVKIVFEKSRSNPYIKFIGLYEKA